jgi:hypothetical protein
MEEIFMEKTVINKLGVHYLLGINSDGQKVWLEKQSWDCGWYWGFGYLHTFRRNDFDSHFHFDSTFLNGPECSYTMFKTYFKETVLTENEIWALCDLMKTFYTLRAAAEVFHSGHSHQTERAKIESLKLPEQEDLINKVLLPKVFERIEKLLSPLE